MNEKAIPDLCKLLLRHEHKQAMNVVHSIGEAGAAAQVVGTALLLEQASTVDDQRGIEGTPISSNDPKLQAEELVRAAVHSGVSAIALITTAYRMGQTKVGNT